MENKRVSRRKPNLAKLPDPPPPPPPEPILPSQEELLAKLEELERQIELKKNLPHIHGFPWYQWAWDFYQSKNRMNLLVAANQISKSSTQIRKCIEWATNQELWPSLWERTPRQFWYLYPDSNVATAEYHTKWKPEFLPRVDESDPVYGWKPEFENKKLKYIRFNSGVYLYFKTYATDVSSLQSGSVNAIFCDEELPANLYPELRARLMATNGYFHIVFTATLGQDFWYEAIECIDRENERFKDALKLQISIYDCLTYKDGSASPWTLERIQAEEAACRSDAEKLRRVYGKFIKSDNIAVPEYYASQHLTHNPFGPPGTVPSGWVVYGGVDIGSSHGSGHPAAIVFVTVNPARTLARVVKVWRGDGQKTTSGDILNKYVELESDFSDKIVGRCFDQASAEFALVALASNIHFDKSDKDRKSGFNLLNTLFKYGALELDKDLPEIEKLSTELSNVADDSPETVLDDLLATLRYVCKRIPFDFDKILKKTVVRPKTESPISLPIITAEQRRQMLVKKRKEEEIRERRGDFDHVAVDYDPIYEELNEWEDQY